MSVRVVARLRPLLKGEQEEDAIVRVDSGTSVIRIPNPKNHDEDFSFQFNSVYDAQASQDEIFQAEGKNPQYCSLQGSLLTLARCSGANC